MGGVDLLLDRLEGVRRCGPGQWVARCPAHKDKSPSLSISINAKKDGRILLNDFAGCSVDAILDALGLDVSALFAEPLGDHLAPLPREGMHRHAAADALKNLAYLALLVVLIAEDIAARDAPPTLIERNRLTRAAAVLRAAANVV